MQLFYRYFLLSAIISFSFYNSFSQTKIELLHANSLEDGENVGKDVKRLIGNISLKQENTLMYCDSAYLYPNNQIDAFGNVRILQGDSLTIYGDFLKYNGNSRYAEIHKNIRLIQKQTTLQTELLFYDIKSRTANYPEKGIIMSGQNTLTSEKGYYNSRSKTYSFKKNVVLVNPSYEMRSDTLNYNSSNSTAYFSGPTTIVSKENTIYCESGWYNTSNDNALFSRNASISGKQQTMKGDSILYDKANSMGSAWGHVSINDSTQSIIVSGNKAVRNGKKETAIVTGNILLKQYYGQDTLFLHADTLLSVDEHPKNKKGKIDSTITWRNMYAYHHVKFYRSDIQGKCDSLAYSGKDSLMKLYKKPVMWSDKNQLIAEKIDIKTSNGKISRLFMKNNSFIISEEDSSKYNQIKGKDMTGYFQDNKLRKIYVEGNGQTIYFAKDKDKKIGINKAECTNMMIYVKENSVEKISFLKKPTATLFPMKDFLPKEFMLKDFIWRIKERPLSVADIFTL